MSKTNPIKSTSVPSEYDTPLTTLEYLRKVKEQNAQVLARQDEIEEALADRVAKSGDTMTGALNVPQVNATMGVFRALDVFSQDEKTHVKVDNNGFVAEVSVPDLNKKFAFVVGSNGKVALNVHDVPNNRDTLFMFPNADDYDKGTYELATKDDIPSGGLEIERVASTKNTQAYTATINIDIVNDYFAIVSASCDISTAQSTGVSIDFPITNEEKATLLKVFISNRLYLTENTYRVSSNDSYVVEGCGITLITYMNVVRVSFGPLPAGVNCQLHEVLSK